MTDCKIIEQSYATAFPSPSFAYKHTLIVKTLRNQEESRRSVSGEEMNSEICKAVDIVADFDFILTRIPRVSPTFILEDGLCFCSVCSAIKYKNFLTTKYISSTSPRELASQLLTIGGKKRKKKDFGKSVASRVLNFKNKARKLVSTLSYHANGFV